MASYGGIYFGENSAVPNFEAVLERSVNPYEHRSLRVPFYMSSTYREALGVTGVSMKMNPSSVSFRQPKRISRDDVRSGSIFYHWTDRFGRNNDIMEVEFTGQTGNINLQQGTYRKGVADFSKHAEKATDWVNDRLDKLAGGPDGPSTGVQVTNGRNDMSGAAKLANFHNLNSLTREPMIDVVTGQPIFYFIQYSSQLFGNTMLTLIGHFSRALDIEDSADSPNNKRYSFGFTVLSSVPSFNNIYAVVVQNLGKEFMNRLQ